MARNYPRWFERGRELDAPVTRQFAPVVERAGRGELEHWRSSPRGTLALVLALDQFPRHVFRGSARAFAFDAKARAVCEAGLDAGLRRHFSPVEMAFFCLPLEHAEDLAAQERWLALARSLAAEEGAGALRPFLDECVRYAVQHRDIIARFGRFPHRNAALGRTSTAGEREYLDGGATRFGQ